MDNKIHIARIEALGEQGEGGGGEGDCLHVTVIGGVHGEENKRP